MAAFDILIRFLFCFLSSFLVLGHVYICLIFYQLVSFFDIEALFDFLLYCYGYCEYFLKYLHYYQREALRREDGAKEVRPREGEKREEVHFEHHVLILRGRKCEN